MPRCCKKASGWRIELGAIETKDLERVVVYTTVQEKGDRASEPMQLMHRVTAPCRAWASPPTRPASAPDCFRRHNVANLNEMLPFFGDETRRLSAAKAGREQLEKQFAEDRAALDRSVGFGQPKSTPSC